MPLRRGRLRAAARIERCDYASGTARSRGSIGLNIVRICRAVFGGGVIAWRTAAARVFFTAGIAAR